MPVVAVVVLGGMTLVLVLDEYEVLPGVMLVLVLTLDDVLSARVVPGVVVVGVDVVVAP